MTALASTITQENELQNLLRASITLGNVAHESAEATSLCLSLGIQWPDEANWQAVAADNVEGSRQTIREIKAMLT